MSEKTHTAVVAVAALAMLGGAALWLRWGALISMADLVAWCG